MKFVTCSLHEVVIEEPKKDMEVMEEFERRMNAEVRK